MISWTPPVHDIMAGVQYIIARVQEIMDPPVHDIMAGVQYIMDGVQEIMDSARYCILTDFIDIIYFFTGSPFNLCWLFQCLWMSWLLFCWQFPWWEMGKLFLLVGWPFWYRIQAQCRSESWYWFQILLIVVLDRIWTWVECIHFQKYVFQLFYSTFWLLTINHFISWKWKQSKKIISIKSRTKQY